MEDLIAKIILVLLIGVVCAIVSTNLINGLKDSIGLSDIKVKWLKTLLIKVLTFAVDGFIDYWVYFGLMELTDIATFVVVVLCTIAGAETVYSIIGSLNELKTNENVTSAASTEILKKKTEVTEETEEETEEPAEEVEEEIDNNDGYLPCTVANLTTEYRNYKPYHTGIDLGWIDEAHEINCPILAWNDGVVVDKGFQASTRGNYVTIRHSLNGKYRYTNYLHMRDAALVNVGDEVKANQQIGVKGTTGGSTGVHLHFATSVLTDSANCKVQWVADNTVNPKECTKLSPYIEYALKKMDWILPMFAKRDKTKHQFKVTSQNLNIRKGPGKSYDKTGEYIPAGLYDVIDTYVEENGYTWYKLATDRWIASAWCDDHSTYGIDLPANK